MGAAWARHAMCESAFSVVLVADRNRRGDYWSRFLDVHLYNAMQQSLSIEDDNSSAAV